MKYLTTKEAAAKLNYASDAIIRQMIQKKRLKAEKFGAVWMIPEQELRKFEKSLRPYKRKPKQ
jgi:excisionase family DNA binding protein